jgi:hypothetical protein
MSASRAVAATARSCGPWSATAEGARVHGAEVPSPMTSGSRPRDAGLGGAARAGRMFWPTSTLPVKTVTLPSLSVDQAARFKELLGRAAGLSQGVFGSGDGGDPPPKSARKGGDRGEPVEARKLGEFGADARSSGSRLFEAAWTAATILDCVPATDVPRQRLHDVRRAASDSFSSATGRRSSRTQ